MNQSTNNSNMIQSQVSNNPFSGVGLFDNMNLTTKPAAAVPFSNGVNHMDLFSGLTAPT